ARPEVEERDGERDGIGDAEEQPEAGGKADDHADGADDAGEQRAVVAACPPPEAREAVHAASPPRLGAAPRPDTRDGDALDALVDDLSAVDVADARSGADDHTVAKRGVREQLHVV